MEFAEFAAAVRQRFDQLSAAGPLFRTAISGDEIWETYLSSFPPGTNAVYRKRREYDCSCCRQFIQAVGNVVSLADGEVRSIWQIEVIDRTFQIVADALERKVTSAPIADTFLHYEPRAGTASSFEQTASGAHEWKHFFAPIAPTFVKPAQVIPSLLGETREAANMLSRGLATISFEALDTVIDLCAANNLYKGEEFLPAVQLFRQVKQACSERTSDARLAFVWSHAATLPPSISRLRNTLIGTLLTDLSEGAPLEAAVAAYEAKAAPTNYKRPKALVTQVMLQRAKDDVTSMGLMSALQRRYAVLEDLSINNLIFADRITRKTLGGNPFTQAAASIITPAPKNPIEIEAKEFFSFVLPRSTSVELLVENHHAPNFVSLLAPVDPAAAKLFKWDNGFSWSYTGDVTDSIRERVKAAGGNISGDLCCRLAWNNFSDLDLHMLEPNGYRIYFYNKGRKSPSGGELDVDMNAVRGQTRSPVENIFYHSENSMQEGTYKLLVHSFALRETQDTQLEVEIDWKGDVRRCAYPYPARNEGLILVAVLNYTKKAGIVCSDGTSVAPTAREIWNLRTQQFHTVRAICNSPNYWDFNCSGNQHVFFLLEGCKNSETARGFYNEFLNDALAPHRKALELVGSQVRTDNSDRQLSGLGFSITQRNSVICRVTSSTTRTFKINF